MPCDEFRRVVTQNVDHSRRADITGEFITGGFITGEFITGEFITGEFITGELLVAEAWFVGCSQPGS